MIVVLDEIHSNLSNALVEFTNQLGFDTKDSEKIANLSGKYNCFSSEKKTCAYDYINMINDRIEKVEKMYEYIKDIS